MQNNFYINNQVIPQHLHTYYNSKTTLHTWAWCLNTKPLVCLEHLHKGDVNPQLLAQTCANLAFLSPATNGGWDWVILWKYHSYKFRVTKNKRYNKHTLVDSRPYQCYLSLRHKGVSSMDLAFLKPGKLVAVYWQNDRTRVSQNHPHMLLTSIFTLQENEAMLSGGYNLKTLKCTNLTHLVFSILATVYTCVTTMQNKIQHIFIISESSPVPFSVNLHTR